MVKEIEQPWTLPNTQTQKSGDKTSKGDDNEEGGGKGENSNGIVAAIQEQNQIRSPQDERKTSTQPRADTKVSSDSKGNTITAITHGDQTFKSENGVFHEVKDKKNSPLNPDDGNAFAQLPGGKSTGEPKVQASVQKDMENPANTSQTGKDRRGIDKSEKGSSINPRSQETPVNGSIGIDSKSIESNKSNLQSGKALVDSEKSNKDKSQQQQFAEISAASVKQQHPAQEENTASAKNFSIALPERNRTSANVEREVEIIAISKSTESSGKGSVGQDAVSAEHNIGKSQILESGKQLAAFDNITGEQCVSSKSLGRLDAIEQNSPVKNAGGQFTDKNIGFVVPARMIEHTSGTSGTGGTGSGKVEGFGTKIGGSGSEAGKGGESGGVGGGGSRRGEFGDSGSKGGKDGCGDGKFGGSGKKDGRAEGKHADETSEGERSSGSRSDGTRSDGTRSDGNRREDKHGERGDDKPGSRQTEGERKPDKVRNIDDTTKSDSVKGGKTDGRADGGKSGVANDESAKGDRAEGKSVKSDKANEVKGGRSEQSAKFEFQDLLAKVQRLPQEAKNRGTEIISKLINNPEQKFEGKDRSFADALRGLNKTELKTIRDILSIGSKPDFSALSQRLQEKLSSILKPLMDGNKDEQVKDNRGQDRQTATAIRLTDRTVPVNQLLNESTLTRVVREQESPQTRVQQDSPTRSNGDRGMIEAKPHEILQQIMQRLAKEGVIQPASSLFERTDRIEEKNTSIYEGSRSRLEGGAPRQSRQHQEEVAAQVLAEKFSSGGTVILNPAQAEEQDGTVVNLADAASAAAARGELISTSDLLESKKRTPQNELLLYRDIDEKRKKSKPRTSRSHFVQKGETLLSIAEMYFAESHSLSGARAIFARNAYNIELKRIDDKVYACLEVGQMLAIPMAEIITGANASSSANEIEIEFGGHPSIMGGLPSNGHSSMTVADELRAVGEPISDVELGMILAAYSTDSTKKLLQSICLNKKSKNVWLKEYAIMENDEKGSCISLEILVGTNKMKPIEQYIIFASHSRRECYRSNMEFVQELPQARCSHRLRCCVGSL